MKFSLVNLGCKVNRVESDSIGAALLAAGWDMVDEGADVAIVNTCTVTAEADRKTRKEVNRAVARNAGAPVLVTGCAATIDPRACEALSSQVRVVDKAHVIPECLALAELGSGEETAHGHKHAAEYEHVPALLRLGEVFPTRVGIKVQDGCDNACTYCIVHVARGKAWSVPARQVLDEVKSYAEAGVREIVLTGIDLGAYFDDGLGLASLIRRLRAAAPETRFRISSIEPVTIDDALIELLATEDGMVCRHLHVPLQSGSPKILHDMARRYSAEEYAATIQKLRRAIPGLSLTTDVIVGFPGETKDDFMQTLEVARACGFSRMHIFRYSRREGTPAAERSDQIAPDVKAQRMERLQIVANELRRLDACARLGSQERILIEANGRGMSESYYEVQVPESMQVGTLVEARLRTYDEKDGTIHL